MSASVSRVNAQHKPRSMSAAPRGPNHYEEVKEDAVQAVVRYVVPPSQTKVRSQTTTRDVDMCRIEQVKAFDLA
jgi:hypothetical protein